MPDPNPKNPTFISRMPERVLPRSVLRELVENDRIVGGSLAMR